MSQKRLNRPNLTILFVLYMFLKDPIWTLGSTGSYNELEIQFNSVLLQAFVCSIFAASLSSHFHARRSNFSNYNFLGIFDLFVEPVAVILHLFV